MISKESDVSTSRLWPIDSLLPGSSQRQSPSVCTTTGTGWAWRNTQGAGETFHLNAWCRIRTWRTNTTSINININSSSHNVSHFLQINNIKSKNTIKTNIPKNKSRRSRGGRIVYRRESPLEAIASSGDIPPENVDLALSHRIWFQGTEAPASTDSPDITGY